MVSEKRDPDTMYVCLYSYFLDVMTDHYTGLLLRTLRFLRSLSLSVAFVTFFNIV